MGNPAESGGRRPGDRASNFSVTCRRLSQYLKEKGSFGDLTLGITPTARGPLEGKPEVLRTLNLLPGVEAEPQMGGEDGPSANGDAVAGDRKANSSKSMDLFPRRPGFGARALSGSIPDFNRELQTAPMTIFYGGKVIVFDNFPADKATELMDMAGRVCPPPDKRSPVEQAAGPPQPRPSSPPPPVPHHSSPATALASSSETRPASGVSTAFNVAATPMVVEQEASKKQTPQASSDLPIARRVSLHRFLEKRKDRITTKAPYEVNVSSASPGSSSACPAKGEVDGRQWLGLAPQASKSEDSGGCRWRLGPTKTTGSDGDKS